MMMSRNKLKCMVQGLQELSALASRMRACPATNELPAGGQEQVQIPSSWCFSLCNPHSHCHFCLSTVLFHLSTPGTGTATIWILLDFAAQSGIAVMRKEVQVMCCLLSETAVFCQFMVLQLGGICACCDDDQAAPCHATTTRCCLFWMSLIYYDRKYYYYD